MEKIKGLLICGQPVKDEDVLLVRTTDGAFKQNLVCSALDALYSKTVGQMFVNGGKRVDIEEPVASCVAVFTRELLLYCFSSLNANKLYTLPCDLHS